jgi:hypothetical protein
MYRSSIRHLEVIFITSCDCGGFDSLLSFLYHMKFLLEISCIGPWSLGATFWPWLAHSSDPLLPTMKLFNPSPLHSTTLLNPLYFVAFLLHVILLGDHAMVPSPILVYKFQHFTVCTSFLSSTYSPQVGENSRPSHWQGLGLILVGFKLTLPNFDKKRGNVVNEILGLTLSLRG